MRLRHSPAGSGVLPEGRRRFEGVQKLVRSAAARADSLAVRLAKRPLGTLAGLLLLDGVLAVCFVAGGLALNGDQAEMFRELTPGTVLSFAQLLFVAAIAWAIHTRADRGRSWRSSLWGLSTVVLLVFAFDEITQSAIVLASALEHGLGVAPAGGFHDLEAVLLTLLFAAAALVVLPHLPSLLRHPTALLVLVLAVCLGLTSQALDSFAAATRWEFVAEESLKLAAEAFLVGGFLMVLRDVLGGAATPVERAASAPRAA